MGYSVDDILDPDQILQLGVAPVRIDILSEIPGIADFTEAWEHRVEASFGNAPATYVGLDDLIRAKEATDRDRDREDVRILRATRYPDEPSD